ncbi:hypothetical protein BK138_09765 [Paenibacillus rhizosphaerae]|uniref:Copper amine oxidase-like N-terminal domain-containing protein n=1 Tax=Paenibacillus rhizosphaerae TaxID=297318 RepID=A0A1R1F3T1_9BACL|nr:DL-endopeptidase inhibitor IseA family protein [Paenibacillus rhizosphaerae]OMF58768.1 hypothetical protein BK138_09765 [Paenibacillus rhizosphaerae]
MKLNRKIGFTLATGLMGASLLAAAAGAAPAGSVTVPAQVPAQTVEKVVVTDATKISKLNHTSVTPLIIVAEKRYFYALGGGKGLGDTFKVDGREYRYLSDDIGTREKLMNYLKSVYTEKAAAYFVDKYFISHDGRLAQLNADGGNILEFDKATAKLLSMTDTQRVYKLSVPYPEHLQGPAYVTVKFEKVGQFWRVGTAPHAIF